MEIGLALFSYGLDLEKPEGFTFNSGPEQIPSFYTFSPKLIRMKDKISKKRVSSKNVGNWYKKELNCIWSCTKIKTRFYEGKDCQNDKMFQVISIASESWHNFCV